MPKDFNEPKMRLEVVSEQRRIELSVAQSKQGAAVFCVPTLLTPMFISPKVVVHDEKAELFKLKSDSDVVRNVPDGLIPNDKMADEKQLSTILGRVISVEEMLQKGTKVVVLYAGERIKLSSKEEQVDDSHIKVLAQKYPKNLVLKKISPELYAQQKDNVCAATYCYTKDDQQLQIGIDATQIHKADESHDWGVRREKEAQQKATNLDGLLNQLNLPSIRKLITIDNIQLKTRKNQSHQLVRLGVFGAIVSAAAYVTFKLITKENAALSGQQRFTM